MLKCLKHHLHKLIPALFLLLLLPLLSGAPQRDSVFSADCELIILWEDHISSEEAARRLSSVCPDLTLTDHLDDFSICRSDTPDSLTHQLELLNADTSVRVAERNSSVTLCYSMGDATYFDGLWGLHNTGEYIYYINDLPVHRTAAADIDMNLPEAYTALDGLPARRPVTVAIIDTGVDIAHPALVNHIWTNPAELPDNGIDDDGNGYIDDTNGWDFYNNDSSVCHYPAADSGLTGADPADNDNHGTHCAGIIAASEGVFGVASGIDVRILPLKIHGGERNTGSVSDAIKAIKYAQTANADICNLSWGTTLYSEALETVMKESDMLFVVAAGNSGSNNNSSPLYPASYTLDNMISVANITQTGTLASDSNYGVSTVDIAAPGQDILSTTVNGEYHYLSGTSMAAPMVSGVSALLYAYGEAPYPQNIKEILLQTLKPMESLTGYIRYPGIPDAYLVVSALDSLANDTVAPTLTASTQYRETTLLVTVDAEDLGGSGIRTLRYATGALDVSYFGNGTMGLSVTDGILSLNKSGTYTFYCSDYAGNETVYVYSVQDDTTPPELSASYEENADGSFTVTVSVNDSESGIKRVRYLEGVHPESAFLAAGENLHPETSYTFLAPAEATYTIYATDYRSNKSTYTLEVKRIPAESLFLNLLECTVPVGATTRLLPLVLPFTSTDYLSYEISDETLLYIAEDGSVTALAPGTASVTVRSSSGLSKQCIFHIVETTPALPQPEPTSVPEPVPTPTPQPDPENTEFEQDT
ncbi:MAG: S8 family serine peptidase [Lachnospiraceae bacterium]|nr:S8 family serine peptidase [Lachnospiraceae bacterium]